MSQTAILETAPRETTRKLHPDCARVLRAVKEHAGATKRELARELAMTENKASTWLRWLAARDLIEIAGFRECSVKPGVRATWRIA